MPVTKKDLDELPVSFCGEDEVRLMVGSGGASFWRGSTIPYDGRTYIAGGRITFKNGRSFRASFRLATGTPNVIRRDSIYLSIGEDWYRIDEPELLTRLQLSKEDIYPLTWRTDRPLDHHHPQLLQDEPEEGQLSKSVLFLQWLRRLKATL